MRTIVQYEWEESDIRPGLMVEIDDEVLWLATGNAQDGRGDVFYYIKDASHRVLNIAYGMTKQDVVSNLNTRRAVPHEGDS